jgi:hypothetical protein
VEQENDTLVVYVQSCTTYSRCFAQINDRINEEMAAHPEYADDVALQSKIHI